MEDISYTQTEEYKELKELLTKLLVNSYKTAVYCAKLEIDKIIKKCEFYHWDINKVLSELRKNKVDEIEDNDDFLNKAIREYQFTIIDFVPDEINNDDTYFDFLATYITPYCYENNEKNLESEIYKNQSNEEKYDFWNSLLFDRFVSVFESYFIIKILNKIYEPEPESENSTMKPEIDKKKFKFELTKEIEVEVLKVFQFWENIENSKFGYVNIFKEITQQKFIEMITNADFSEHYKISGISQRVGITISLLSSIIKNEQWTSNVTEKLAVSLKNLEKNTRMPEYDVLKTNFPQWKKTKKER